MNLSEYFSTHRGTGVLATADQKGQVNTAIYARPHVIDKDTVAMVMRERLTHKNLQENPYAAYLFRQDSPGYQGVRLVLKKLREDDNPELIAQLTRRNLSPEEDRAKGPKHIVYFKIEKILTLIGGEELEA